MTETTNPEDLLEFPCHFTFKAMGVSGELFVKGITAAARNYAAVPQDAISIRPSRNGNYQSVSIIVCLKNYQQLKDIYAGMKEVAGLKMLL
ncbi:YbeD family protein [Geopsychrobacter electrodiphilus]|uniref:YbeD family protein n=1 Tax=Geopsychrobacter electrodiphilus TaxID=225196 RepID=UPI00036B56C2|nr:DUF493 domain-containing protein [Geopsychrobacter electrodiphilus]